MMRVGDYLRHSAALPFDWAREGAHDCCTFVAEWVVLRGNPDPMAFIRGRYDSAASALRRIVEGGGLVPLWTRGMIEAGVPEADEAREGDVGVLHVPTDDGVDQACGLFTGERWATRGLSGIEIAPATPLIVWRP